MKEEKYISIIKDNQKLIYKICYSYCSNPDKRKDLQQEILLQIWASFSKYDGRVKMSTWIYRIALNTAISFYREERKHNKIKLVEYESIISSINHEADFVKDENYSILFTFIEQLNKFDKALMLLYLEDVKYREMADILGITETNVATKINRIKKRLQNQFRKL